MTRADIGNAEMPVAPIIGLTFFFEEQVDELGKQDAADRVKNEGDQTERR